MKRGSIFARGALLYWLSTVCYMGLIYYLSSINGGRLSGWLHGYDKPVHLLIYMILAFLFYLSLNRSGVRRYLLIISFLFAVIYGITDEIHQLYVPLRDASVGDVVANSIGALLGSYSASRFS